MVTKVYRLENPNTRAGVWYNADSTPNGVIHTLTEGKSASLPMDFDSKYRKDGFEWFSAYCSIKDLVKNFSPRDVYELQLKGYYLYEYEVSQYWVDKEQAYFTREGVVSQKVIPFSREFDMSSLFINSTASDMVNAQGLTEAEFLKGYKIKDYERPSVTADIVIFGIADKLSSNRRKPNAKALQILLIKRKDHPFMGKWALPGGFVEPQESVGEAARRELIEETGISNAHLEQLATFSTPGRDPRAWIITVAHMALVNAVDLAPVAGDDAQEATLFNISVGIGRDGSRELWFENGDECFSEDELAFDHKEIIWTAWQRLQSKLEWTDIALSLMPAKFALTELQRIYEVILDKKLFLKMFRNMVERWVVETDEFEKGVARRPARLYKRKYDVT